MKRNMLRFKRNIRKASIKFKKIIKKQTIKKNFKKIFILGIARLPNNCCKIVYVKNFRLVNLSYKGYFLEEKSLNDNFLLNYFDLNDFNKWYKVEVDNYGDILCLYYKKRKINL